MWLLMSTAVEWEHIPFSLNPGHVQDTLPSGALTTLYVPWSPMTLYMLLPKLSTRPVLSSLSAFSITLFAGFRLRIH